MLAEVCREVREAFVAEVLDGADDGGGVDVVALRELARRQKVGLFVIVENRPDQFASIAAQLRVSEAHLERREAGLACVSILGCRGPRVHGRRGEQ